MIGNRGTRALAVLSLILLTASAACRPVRSRSGPVTATPPGPLIVGPTATLPAESVPSMPTETPLLVLPTPTPPLSPVQPPTPVPVAPQPTPAPPAETVTHVVQPGETLFRIAMRYGTTVEAIVRANQLINPDFIVPGQRLVIPAGSSAGGAPTGGERIYIVQPGDNLFRIGLKFNMTWTVIAARNGITNPNAIFPGQRLIIPSP